MKTDLSSKHSRLDTHFAPAICERGLELVAAFNQQKREAVKR
ncbi:hypothetical protein [Pelagicoccus sp. SDUM812002]|nr:hypothetical protein [Pelagicoccus sp. SDUM812002]